MLVEWFLKHPVYIASLIAIAIFDSICYGYLVYDYFKRRLKHGKANIS